MARSDKGKGRGVSYRVRLHREKLEDGSPMTLAIADELLAWGTDVVNEAGGRAPDSPYDPYPTGEGLPKQGGVLTFVGGQKTGGYSIRGTQPKKPRAARAAIKKNVIALLVGFGFPAHLAEGGTIRTPAHAFLLPTINARLGELPGRIARRLDGMK